MKYLIGEETSGSIGSTDKRPFKENIIDMMSIEDIKKLLALTSLGGCKLDHVVSSHIPSEDGYKEIKEYRIIIPGKADIVIEPHGVYENNQNDMFFIYTAHTIITQLLIRLEEAERVLDDIGNDTTGCIEMPRHALNNKMAIARAGLKEIK